MATTSHAQAVKSLNKSPGRRRFVFKTFSQRVEDIDIDVYRSLDKVKSEPSEGSSFFRDCLIKWRELNTAEDFICLHEELFPLAPTLPLVLLHQKTIFSKLVSRLNMKARLSLEPILCLIAELSRDLLEDFLPFLEEFVGALVSLLESGADREPDIIEQIFSSLSHVMMYLQKYLTRNIPHVLRVTVNLRYYPKEYVQEFIAEALSFLLRSRNTSVEQFIRGIMVEVVEEPSEIRKSGVSALLSNAMKGTSSRLHSRAEHILQSLMGKSLFKIGDKSSQGSDAIVEVVSGAFERICEDLEAKELSLIFNCLYREISESIAENSMVRANRLLTVLVSSVGVDKGHKVSDYGPLLELMNLLVKTLPSSHGSEDWISNIIDNVLSLIIGILEGLSSCNDLSAITSCSIKWAPVFQLQHLSLLKFIGDLLQKDITILDAFRDNIIRALDKLMESSNGEVIYLLLSFCEKMEAEMHGFNLYGGMSEVGILGISSSMSKIIKHWIGLLSNLRHKNIEESAPVEKTSLALLWGVIRCYPYVFDDQENVAMLMTLVDSLDQLLMTEDNLGFSRHTWQSMIGAALSSYCKTHTSKGLVLEDVSKMIQIVKRYKSSQHVLVAIADCLDSVLGSGLEKMTLSDIKNMVFEKGIDYFAENLSHPDKLVRLSTLRILHHFEPIHDGKDTDEVLTRLLSIEETPLSVSTSRKVILVISKIQMDVSGGRINEAYALWLLYGMIGIFQSRFSSPWAPATECVAVLIRKNTSSLWDRFIQYFEECQSGFLASQTQPPNADTNMSDESSDLVERFDLFVDPPRETTPCESVLSLLIQSLQKIPDVSEAKSRQLIPLFLKFLGYKDDDISSLGSFNSSLCKGKKWKGILKEWLNLLILMRNARSFYRSQFLKDVLQHRLLDENDADIQTKVLDCLLMWKDTFLVPYELKLKNLICTKTLREELTTWSLSKESTLIEEDHRPDLVPLVIRILSPKVRKLKKLASRKHASVYHRKAVLSFIAEVDVNELPLFFALLIKPLQIVSAETEWNWYWSSGSISKDDFLKLDLLKYFSVENMAALSMKKIYGFLHVVEDVLATFDEFHIKAFLNLLMGFVARVLGSCTSFLAKSTESQSSLDNNKSSTVEDWEAANHTLINTSQGHVKDVRSLCLRILSTVLNKYEDHDFGSQFWDMFFFSAKPLIDNFKQGGSSSEKPSSLFFCFLSMSRSARLVSLLFREKNLIPDIFSILSSEKVSEAVVSGVLKFIENLLILDSDLGEEENSVRGVLVMNLETLICSLHSLFLGNSLTKRKLLKSPSDAQFRIFKLLPKYLKDTVLARKFMDILLPFITSGSQNADLCQEVLQVVKDIIPLLGSGCSTEILNAVSPLLTSVELERRISICNLLMTLTTVDLSLLVVGRLLHQLNAFSAMEGGLDYDTVINAYESIQAEFFGSLTVDHALLILSQFVYDISSDEMILRHSAYRSLLAFVDFCAKIVLLDVEDDGEMAEAMLVDGWTRLSVERCIDKFLLKHMGVSVREGKTIRKEWIDLLRAMVMKLPGVANLDTLNPLCSEDAEVDFFNNLVHLQKHRRARALTRFRNVIGTARFSEVIMKKVFVPMFFNMLFDVQEGKNEQIKNSCMEAIAAISAQMDWNSYYALLTRCFREISLDFDKQKVVVRMICAILDRFHFPATDPDVQQCLERNLLPKVQKLVNADSDKVNISINIAALKLLKLLPGEKMDTHLPSIVHRVSNFLKSRMESVRDEARSALAACLKEIGLDYLQFILKALRATLKRGYEMHVLGYTLNFLLSKALANNPNGVKLDYCLDDLLSVVENDILGEVAEQKDVEKIASKMRETKKRMSYETLRLIAQNVTFRSHGLKLLSPVAAHLKDHLTPKVKTKLESMLSHIATGIESNPSVDQTDLFIFVYGLIEDGIDKENGATRPVSGTDLDLPKKPAEGKKRGKKTVERRVITKELLSSHMITGFALTLLHNRLKKMKLNKGDEELLSKLDPFVKLLCNCLGSKYEDVLSTSLRCLTPLVRLPLPSLEPQADKIKAALLDIAQNSVSSSSPLTDSCLKLLTALLRNSKITLSDEQLRVLIMFPMFVDLERNPSFVALSLLKAIVHRTIRTHEIFDLMTKVAELMVKSQLESVRNKCSQTLLPFLLNYGLSDKRLLQHLDFLHANLRYEHSSGREAVLEMLHVVIVKFPKRIIEAQYKAIFFDLVLCLANDNDNKVRLMTGAVIKLLVGHINRGCRDSILGDSMSWYSGEKKQLRGAAAQVLGLFVEVMKKDFKSEIEKLWPTVKSTVQAAVTVAANTEQDLPEGSALPFWKEAYYSLVLMEKVLHQFPDSSFDAKLEDIWEAICELLLHPHTWVWTISCRLISFYFATMTEQCSKKNTKITSSFFLMKPSRLFLISASLCCQLRSQISDESSANLIAENIMFAMCGLHSFAKQMGPGAWKKFWKGVGEDEQVRFMRGFELLDPRNGKAIFLDLASDVVENDQKKDEDVRYLPVRYLVKKMGKIAVLVEPVSMKIVFDTFQKLASQIGGEDSMIYADEMLLPVYKVSEGYSGTLVPDDLKQLGQEIAENMRSIIGIDNFVRVYSRIRKDMEGKRDMRKREINTTLADPVRNAKRKLRIAAKNRGNKKRKIMSLKMQRWMR